MQLSRFVAELANMVSEEQQPFVGYNAFTHKGGIHLDAVGKQLETYEHVDPQKVRILVTEQAGRSNIGRCCGN